VSGYIPAKSFFQCLSAAKVSTTVTIRKRNQLDYLPSRTSSTMFRTRALTPIRYSLIFPDYGQGRRGRDNEEDTTRMARLFWFTVEFGLIREGPDQGLRLGTISSHGDAANALGPKCDRPAFFARRGF